MPDITNILNVKLNDNWVEIPAIKGTSIRYVGAAPTSKVVPIGGGQQTQTGTIIGIYDEAAHATQEIPTWDGLNGFGVTLVGTTPTSQIVSKAGQQITQTGTIVTLYDEYSAASSTYIVWDGLNGIDGEGAVDTVDGIGVDSNATNVTLQAVSYGRAQVLTTEQQGTARSNINAQPAGNYIASPSDKVVHQFLKYLGNDTWTTDSVSVYPSGGDAGYILMKTSPSNDDVTWVATMTTSEIDNILNAE